VWLVNLGFEICDNNFGKIVWEIYLYTDQRKARIIVFTVNLFDCHIKTVISRDIYKDIILDIIKPDMVFNLDTLDDWTYEYQKPKF